ncbi:thymidine phosphorylase [Frankia sp. CNm7]|uniref:Thymidine phosphorylase n=1 Tax=Frankia nepalensis TaxID=1836974 RepID=A0A937UUW0_9ACTN|nr:thymidine phosphorylase [Frankia nepalensis]MBL7495930.1 thymidine phosphorylase [Frankia nepalensis]MBL7513597.1 thymidine phosphorylase [Frankia nepalensis]MBL7523204.1 thymidine phosphorylase [Frankia nepalensis]MBL7632655.1 thymidine phosphorylase [Frankia nepalensis]
MNADASARAIDAVVRTRTGTALAANEIERLVADFVAGRIPDYQMSAWLATVACRGLSRAETVALTRAYVTGGETLDFAASGRVVLDKHSTGGVGDTVSLVVVPLVAACGVAVAKMSGRGLGLTGGTIDKLESIRGLRLELDADDVYRMVDQVGMVITGQSAGLTPGDKVTYALRDVTGTVDSLPLIAASIVSKKIAVGAHGVLFDVKTGAGALIPDRDRAVELARLMVEVATGAGLRCRAVLTDMSQPLGYAVGNALEVREALDVLRGREVPGLTDICRTIAELMLRSADPDLTPADAERKVSGILAGGEGYEQFVRWAVAQGAEPAALEEPDGLPTAECRTQVVADRGGYVREVDPRAIGTAAMNVGAGRFVKGGSLDYSAGVVLRHRVGDQVAAGEPLAVIHHRHGVQPPIDLVKDAFQLSESAPPSRPVLLQVI